MSIQNGRLPIKVTAAAYEFAEQCAVAGVILTSSTGAAIAASAVVQDGNNNDLVTLNTTTSSGVSGVMFPFPVSMKGLSVPSLTGSGAVLYIYLADV
jgi:hypothetical protein